MNTISPWWIIKWKKFEEKHEKLSKWVYQALWYFIAWVAISLICNGFNNLWMPIASAYVAPAVYNLLVTFITGGVSMVIFFFVFKIIFPEGEKK